MAEDWRKVPVKTTDIPSQEGNLRTTELLLRLQTKSDEIWECGLWFLCAFKSASTTVARLLGKLTHFLHILSLICPTRMVCPRQFWEGLNEVMHIKWLGNGRHTI